MNVLLTIDKYNKNNLYLNNPVTNSIIKNGEFIRIVYSDKNITMNGLCLELNIKNFTIDKYFDKYKCIFNINEQDIDIKKLQNIEKDILQKLNNNFSPKFTLCSQLESGLIKFFNNENKTAILKKTINNGIFMLKISGIWLTKLEYGITYKFVPIKFNHQF